MRRGILEHGPRASCMPGKGLATKPHLPNTVAETELWARGEDNVSQNHKETWGCERELLPVSSVELEKMKDL